ncbi:MAG: signal peptidase II [Clostridia bacterium]|nr:signal peptidase II [Clostridia bacterium]
MIWAIIIILAVIADQGTKYLIVNNVEYARQIPVISNFFYITYSRNKGAAWGIFQNGRYFFIVVTVIVSIVLAYMLVTSNNNLLRTSLSMILGGAAGNFIDRVREGSVVDFLDFYFGSYNFPTFNAADSFVVVGTILLAYYLLFNKTEEIKEEIKEEKQE